MDNLSSDSNSGVFCVGRGGYFGGSPDNRGSAAVDGFLPPSSLAGRSESEGGSCKAFYALHLKREREIERFWKMTSVSPSPFGVVRPLGCWLDTVVASVSTVDTCHRPGESLVPLSRACFPTPLSYTLQSGPLI
ncbi:unnamed protein product [Lathyrus oleraceus]